MVPSKKNIGGWEEHTRFGGVGRGGLRNGALIFIVTVYVNSTYHHPLAKFMTIFGKCNPKLGSQTHGLCYQRSMGYGLWYAFPCPPSWWTAGAMGYKRLCPVKVNSMLSCQSLQDFCRHRRITVALKFTSQLGFWPFCRFFPARLCLKNHHRDMNGQNFCLNQFFSTPTCTFQLSSVPGKYFVFI